MMEETEATSKPNRRTSAMWQFFNMIPKSHMATCKICHNDFSYRTSRYNLKSHLRSKHKHIFDTLQNGEVVRPDDQGDISEREDFNKPHRRTSAMWQFFKVIPKSHNMATCKICHNDFSYRTSTHNLKSHLRSKHKHIYDALQNGEVVMLDDQDDMSEREEYNKKSRKKSNWWHVFSKIGNFKAKCKICHNSFSFRTSSGNLRRHLVSMHKSILDNLNNDEQTMPSNENEEISEREEIIESEAETSVQTKNVKNRSKAWKYFEKVDEVNHIAKCKLCENELTYTYISNLSEHLQNLHQVCETEDSSSDDDDDFKGMESDEENQQEKSRAMAWLYFKCLDPVLKISMCLICKKRLSSIKVANLKKHLMKKHPQLKLPEEQEGSEKQMIISEDGQLYEIETIDEKVDLDEKQNGTEAIDTVYLEDYIDDEPQVIENKPRLKRKRYNKVKTNKVIQKILSSDEEVSRKKYQIKEDTLDHFAKYATSLLRQLPKNISDQLQMDFIKEILNAKINLSQTVTVMPSSGYSITITNPDASEKNEVSNSVDELNK